MKKPRIKEEGFCIFCNKKIPFKIEQPACATCGGSCSMTMRSSSTEDAAMFCHGCGIPTAVFLSNPLCHECKMHLVGKKPI